MTHDVEELSRFAARLSVPDLDRPAALPTHREFRASTRLAEVAEHLHGVAGDLPVRGATLAIFIEVLGRIGNLNARQLVGVSRP